MLSRATFLSAVGIVVIASRMVFGQGVGPGSPVETTHALEGVGSIPEDPTHWRALVGSPSDRISVELDPAGPAWVKHLTLPTSYVYGILPGNRIRVTEYLTISGQRTWTGWQDEILSPDFEWLASPSTTRFEADGAPAPGLLVDFTPPGIPAGRGLLFSFDPLGSATSIEVSRRLVYTGSVPFFGTLTFRSYPTPEPSTCGMMALALALLPRRRCQSSAA